MDYKIDGEAHVLTFDKDELILLIAIVHEGLEAIKGKESGSVLAAGKYDSARIFVSELNNKILST